MGKHKDGSKGGRGEPYNEPVKVYRVARPEERRLYAKFRGCEDDADVGQRVARMIVRAREAVKLTQEELARALKTNKQTISAIESDAGHVTVKMLGRIARALNRVLEIRIVVAE